MNTPSHSIRDELRRTTHEVHEQLHHHSHFVALFHGSIEMTHYRDLLQRFHGFYLSLDQAIAQTLQVPHVPYDYSPRAGLLANDLADLGFSQAEIDENPTCLDLFDIVTPATLGGVLYVIEGSTLGAAQIDRAAQKILSKDATTGRSFWAWSRAHNKTCWAAMNSYLTQLDHNGAAHDPSIEGARATFAALGDWLAPLELEPALEERLAS